jgi:hypothetical protein
VRTRGLMTRGNGAGALERRAAGRGAGPPVGSSPSGLVARRRWGWVLAGVGAVVVGGWGSASLWLRAGDRVEVVALAGDVSAYETVTRGDLRTVRVAAPEGVDVVAASKIDDLVGRVAASDLPGRSLLVESDLFRAGESVVDTAEAVVGVRVGPGTAPVELARGRRVLAVIVPAQTAASDTGEARGVEGWVLRSEDLTTGTQTGGLSVSVVVPRDEATGVAAAAADDRLSLVALEE